MVVNAKQLEFKLVFDSSSAPQVWNIIIIIIIFFLYILTISMLLRFFLIKKIFITSNDVYDVHTITYLADFV